MMLLRRIGIIRPHPVHMRSTDEELERRWAQEDERSSRAFAQSDAQIRDFVDILAEPLLKERRRHEP